MEIADYNTCWQTLAAISSAIAAIAAVCVANKTFNFQKTLLLKKANIEEMLKLLKQLHDLKLLTVQPGLDAPDEAVIGLNQLISETRGSVKTLESMISPTASADLKKVRDFVDGLRENDVFAHDDNTSNVALSRQLDVAISTLHNIYRTEIK